jgi:hypothetical protein
MRVNRQTGAMNLLNWIMAASLMGWLVNASADESAPLDGWTVTAGKVETVKSASTPKHNRVKGSYTFKSDLPQPGTRMGGACLIADLTDQGVGLKSCQSDQQCNDAYAANPNAILGLAVPPGVPGPHLYCLEGAKSNSPKRCWIRPGPDTSYCTKKPSSAQQYSVPTQVAGNPDSGSVTADPLGNGRKVPWRVTACLNPAVFPPPPGKPPCADTASNAEVTSVGKVRKVRP